jgi:hypothetical protein
VPSGSVNQSYSAASETSQAWAPGESVSPDGCCGAVGRSPVAYGLEGSEPVANGLAECGPVAYGVVACGPEGWGPVVYGVYDGYGFCGPEGEEPTRYGLVRSEGDGWGPDGRPGTYPCDGMAGGCVVPLPGTGAPNGDRRAPGEEACGAPSPAGVSADAGEPE